MSEDQQVVAIGLLTERDLSVLGQGFRRAFRVEESHDFSALLAAIDEAERNHTAPLHKMQMPTPR